MLTKEEITEKIKHQLSYEFNCNPDDFDKDENTITVSALSDRRRTFSDKPFQFTLMENRFRQRICSNVG